ncbi:MAG: hypothetical protein BMS9Abin26_1179 [Gammaproteobacteria bacterium]|nr:MAG: hypothetical protein BMS9Abin26_1179 [Gammaproteobacteria bacterium]
MIMRCLCTVLLSMSLISASATEIHKWTDENGRIHYGDVPQGSTTIGKKQDEKQTEALKQQKEKELNKLRQRQQGYNQRNAAKEEAEEKARARAREKKKRCTAAKRRLAQYRRSNVMARINEKGERVYLDEKQRNKVLRQSERQVKKYCR